MIENVDNNIKFVVSDSKIQARLDDASKILNKGVKIKFVIIDSEKKSKSLKAWEKLSKQYLGSGKK